MPNVKIFVDEGIYADRKEVLRAALPKLRDTICVELSVPVAACQLAIIPVMGMEGQPAGNMEIQYLAKEDRTPEMIEAACAAFRDVIEQAIGAAPAVRATPLDPARYVAIK